MSEGGQGREAAATTRLPARWLLLPLAPVLGGLLVLALPVVGPLLVLGGVARRALARGAAAAADLAAAAPAPGEAHLTGLPSPGAEAGGAPPGPDTALAGIEGEVAAARAAVTPRDSCRSRPA